MLKIFTILLFSYCTFYSNVFAETLMIKCLYTNAFTSKTKKYHKDTLLLTFTLMPNGDIYMNGDKDGMSIFVNKVLNTNNNIITIIEQVPAGTYTMTTIYPNLTSVHSRNTIDISNNIIGHQASQYYGTCTFK